MYNQIWSLNQFFIKVRQFECKLKSKNYQILSKMAKVKVQILVAFNSNVKMHLL